MLGGGVQTMSRSEKDRSTRSTCASRSTSRRISPGAVGPAASTSACSPTSNPPAGAAAGALLASWAFPAPGEEARTDKSGGIDRGALLRTVSSLGASRLKPIGRDVWSFPHAARGIRLSRATARMNRTGDPHRRGAVNRCSRLWSRRASPVCNMAWFVDDEETPCQSSSAYAQTSSGRHRLGHWRWTTAASPEESDGAFGADIPRAMLAPSGDGGHPCRSVDQPFGSARRQVTSAVLRPRSNTLGLSVARGSLSAPRWA